MENGEHWVVAVSGMGEEMFQGAPDSPLPHTASNNNTFPVSAPLSIPAPKLNLNLACKKNFQHGHFLGTWSCQQNLWVVVVGGLEPII